MSKVIIFKNWEGGISVIHPTPEGVKMAGGDIDKIAQKDVPHGQPYKIVDKVDLPEKDEYRNAWIIDDSELTDGVGAESNEFPEEEAE